MITGIHRDRLLSLRIRTGTRFRQTKSAEPFTAQQFGQIFLFLFFRAEFIDRCSTQRSMGRKDHGCGAADFRHFFDGHHIRKHVTAGSAVLLREVNAHHAQFCHLFDGFHREHFFGIHLFCQRLDFIFSKFAVHLLRHLLLFGQVKIHFILRQ